MNGPAAGQFRIEFPGTLVAGLTPAALRDFAAGVLHESIVAGILAARETASKATSLETPMRILVDDGQSSRPPHVVDAGDGEAGATAVRFGVAFPAGGNAIVTIQACGRTASGSSLNSPISVCIAISRK